MAENIFKRALNNLSLKSVTRNTSRSTIDNLKINSWTFIDSYFSWMLGKAGTFRRYTKSYGENPLVYMIVNKIASTSASMERVVLLEDGTTSNSSEILDLLKKPNEQDDQIEFRQKINENLLLTGNAFIRIIKGEGMGIELEVLKTQKTEIVCNTCGDVLSYDYTDYSGYVYNYLPEEILHIKTSNTVNVEGVMSKYGLSPLQSAWVIVESSMEKFKAEASIFKNRGIIGVLSSDSDTPMLDPERKRLQDQFNKDTGGSDKYNSIHISSSKLRYIQTGMSPTDLKLIEGIQSSLRQLCAIYGMPSVLFNDNATSTYNNILEAKKTAYTDVYIPLANKVDKELSRFLSTQLGVEYQSILIDKKTIDVLKSSTNEVAESLNNIPTNVSSRAVESMTINEMRENILNLDPVEAGDILMGAKSQNNEPSEENNEN